MSSRVPLTIAGAGLSGSLLAVFAARRGFDVDVYERRADPRGAEVVEGRSINLALSARGLAALEAVGLREQVEAFALPMAGRMMHGLDGTTSYLPYGRAGQAILSVSRRLLNETLLEAASRCEGVRLHFESRCTDLDPEAGTMVVEQRGDTRTVPVGFVVGADGVWSAVRQRMFRTERFSFSQTFIEHGYKELTIAPGPDGEFQLDPGALHIWPRHEFMMIALPNPDRTFTCTLFLDWESDAECFAKLDTPEAVRAFFHTWFPDALPLLPDLSEQFFENPTGALAYTSCWPWTNGDRTLLLGDAAHAIVPFYGQGMNAAFEDCLELDRMWEQAAAADAELPALGEIARAFARKRKPNADAIRDLALYNFIEMRSRVADPAFLERRRIEQTLMHCFPETYRDLYSLVSFSTVPYSEAQSTARAQGELLDQQPEARIALLVLGFVREWAGAIAGATA
jgi:kynurenine 3-monooxygenase